MASWRVNNIGLWLDEPDSLLGERAAEKLGVSPADLAKVRVVRSVLDARKKGSPRYIYTLEVELASGGRPPKLPPDVTEVALAAEPLPRVLEPSRMPIIIGTGPAGLFCALGLLERGVRSVLIERG